MKKIKITNWWLFISALLGFLGTLLIGIDNFALFQNIANKLPKWRNVNYAITKLNEFNDKLKDGQSVARLYKNDRGFPIIHKIIMRNRPDLSNKKIISIVKNTPATLGGQSFNIVHVQFENNKAAYSLTNEYIFHEWINEYRKYCFLKYGLFLISIGFLVGIIGHIRIKENILKREPEEEKYTFLEFKILIIIILFIVFYSLFLLTRNTEITDIMTIVKKYWIFTAIVFSIFWGIRSVVLFITDPIDRLPKDKKGLYVFRIKYRKFSKNLIGIYQFIFNFIGSFFGWVCLYILIIRVESNLPDYSKLNIYDLILFILVLLGLTGHLPQIAYGLIESIGEIGKKAIDKKQ